MILYSDDLTIIDGLGQVGKISECIDEVLNVAQCLTVNLPAVQ
jgi:hypothetical protein